MKRLLTAAVAAAGLLLAGCGGGSDQEPAAGSSSAAASYPVTVGTLTLSARPEKIISLGPTTTEMLFAIGAGPQVTAVDDQSNFPAGAPRTDLSAFKPNAEAIAAKNPDLVVLTNDMDKIVDQLGKLKIPVYLAPAAQTLDDSYRQIQQLGTLTGHQAEATALTGRMAADIEKIVKDVPAGKALTYYYELGPELYSATSKTYIGSVLAKFGLTNIADAADPDGSKGGYPQLAQEAIVQANPDLIFLADTRCCQQSAETVEARKGWAAVAAVQQGRIHPLDDDIASRWGPRTVDFVRLIADAVAKARG